MTESERYMSILRSAMRVLGMQHRELAKKLGWNPSYLSRLFNGVIDLKVDHLPVGVADQDHTYFSTAIKDRLERGV